VETSPRISYQGGCRVSIRLQFEIRWVVQMSHYAA